MDRSRLEAFSDGVFAVAITLLALDLTVEGPGHGRLLDQLYDKWPAFLAYLISFFMIGIIWVNHHALVRSIIKVDRTLLFLNLVLLLFVVLIPFATGTEADYFPHNDRDAQLAVVLYAGCSSACRSASARSSSGRCTASGCQQPLPTGAALGGPGRGSSAAAWSTWSPSSWRSFNAVAAFVLIALVAVYYILENTPVYPGPQPLRRGRAGGLKATQINSCH